MRIEAISLGLCVAFMTPVQADELDFLEQPVEVAQAEAAGPEPGPQDEPQAQAEAEATAEPQAPRRRAPRTLDEVIVKAQKREQDLQEVPISVSAISDVQIDQSNMEDLNDLSRFTPNLKVQAGGVANFIYIRGLGSGFNEGFDQSVGFFIDDIFYGRVHYLVAGLLDVERVEILRGPQGTLFGKNTVAGAVSIYSGTPGYEWEGELDGSIGGQHQRTIQGMVNIPVWEDRLAARFAGYFTTREGFMYNTTAGVKDGGFEVLTARAKVRFEVTDNLAVTLSYLKNRGEIFHGVRAQLSAAPPLFLALMRQFDPQTETDIENFNTAIDEPAFGVQDSNDFIANVDFEQWNHNFTLIMATSSYNRDGGTDLDGTPIPIFAGFLDQEYTQYTAELRVASPPGTIEYVAGAFFYQGEINDFTFVPVGYSQNYLETVIGLDAVSSVVGIPVNVLSNPLSLLGLDQAVQDVVNLTQGLIAQAPVQFLEQLERREAQFDQLARSWSVYGQLTWNVAPELSLIFGMRFGMDFKDVDYFQQIGTDLVFPGPTLILGPLLELENFSDTASVQETDYAPKVSALWRAFECCNFYATYAQGGKSGGFNALSLRASDTRFEPEKAHTFEAGIKTELFGNTVRLNAGLFRTHFNNLQVSIFNGIDIIVKNAPKAVVQGVEMDLNSIFDFGLSVIGSFAFLDAFYTDFKDGPCIARNVIESQLASSDFCDVTGDRLPNGPRAQASLSLNQVFASEQFGLGEWPVDLVLGGDILYQGKVLLQADSDPLDIQKSYWMFNFRAGLQSRDARYSFSVFLRNITNQIVKLQSVDVPLLTGSHVAVIDQPRTVSFHLTAKF